MIVERWWPDVGMDPFYADEAVVLFHCKCQELLRRLPDKSVHHVITDPPFEDEAHFKQATRKKAKTFSVETTELPFAPIDELTRVYVGREYTRISDGWNLVFCQAEAIAAWRDALLCSTFPHIVTTAEYVRSQLWIKPAGQPQYTGDRPGQGYESIATAWSGRERMWWNGGGRHGIFTVNPQRASGDEERHPTEKPISLMLTLIDLFTKRGQIVLDSFCGRAGLGVAAKMHGRRAILCEMDLKWIEAGAKRLAATKEQMQLFDFDSYVEPVQTPITADGTSILKKKKRKARAL